LERAELWWRGRRTSPATPRFCCAASRGGCQAFRTVLQADGAVRRGGVLVKPPAAATGSRLSVAGFRDAQFYAGWRCCAHYAYQAVRWFGTGDVAARAARALTAPAALHYPLYFTALFTLPHGRQLATLTILLVAGVSAYTTTTACPLSAHAFGQWAWCRRIRSTTPAVPSATPSATHALAWNDVGLMRMGRRHSLHYTTRPSVGGTTSCAVFCRMAATCLIFMVLTWR
jgi:hypothetical protein